MNPHGRIPVLEDGDTIVWESHAVLRYLASTAGDERFWPSHPAARARADQWIEWTQTQLQRSFMDVFWGYYRTPEAERDPVFVKNAIDRTNKDFLLLDGQMPGGGFLLGDDLTLADIPAASTLYRLLRDGHLASVAAQHRGLVRPPAGTPSLPRPRHGAFRLALRKTEFLTVPLSPFRDQ